MSQLPKDFNWKSYLALNPDLELNDIIDEEEAIDHWNQHGYRENRKYQIDDFNWKIYLALNPDLEADGIKDKNQAIDHWYQHGYHEKRNYRVKNLDPNFSWEKYRDQHPELANLEDSVEYELNWIKDRIKIKSIENFNQEPVVLLLSHNLGGGLSKYVRDLITNYSRICHFKYKLITNESKTSAKYLNDLQILDLLKSKGKKILLHLNIFTKDYHQYNLKTISSILTRFKSIEERKLIITVHDFFWLWPQTPNILIEDYRRKDPNNLQKVQEIFELADLIIFPTENMKRRYLQKKVDLSRVHHLIESHCDYSTDDISPYYQQVTDKIRILFLGNFDFHKGSASIKEIFNLPVEQLEQLEQIEFHFLGSGYINFPKGINHGNYEDSKLFHRINQIKPHLFILSSICYESWSYIATIALKSGLPIFYNRPVYQERLQSREATNIYPYDSTDSLDKNRQSLIEMLEDLREKGNQDYHPLNLNSALQITPFYENLYGRFYPLVEENPSNLYLIVSDWGWPLFGGGEQFLYDTMKWASDLGMKVLWICFSTPKSKFLIDNQIQTKYGEIYQMAGGFSVKSLRNKLLAVKPKIVHHQGNYRLPIMNVCNELSIPFMTGFHFWTDAIILGKSGNQEILQHHDHQVSRDFKEILDKSTLVYSCSDFLREAILKVSGYNLLPMIYPCSLEERIKVDPLVEKKYVTMINIHQLKGGEIFLQAIRRSPDIPFLGICTEYYSENLDNQIKAAMSGESKYLTRVENIQEIYSQTRVLLVPSLVDETFCKVAQEGIVNRIPIIATNKGNLFYLLKDAAILLDEKDIDGWIRNIRELYFDWEKRNQLIKRSRLSYSKYNEKLSFYQFKNCLDCCLSPPIERHIALYVPWGDQGLGIQARNYSQFLQSINYKVYIFSFCPYFCQNNSKEIQKNPSEWLDYDDIYYSSNNREKVTDQEIISFLDKYQIDTLMILETCFYRVFEIAQHCRDREIKTTAIPNLEIVRKNEISQHRVFDQILCNNMMTLEKFRSLGFDNSCYLGYSIFNIKDLPEKNLSDQIEFFCSGGLNAITRKECLKVCQAFDLASKAAPQIRLTLTIQGNQIPKEINNYQNHSKIKLIIDHLPYEKILKIYRQNHVYIHVSRHEGLGLGFYEAISTGTPVLTLDTPPHNEIIFDSISGWTIPCHYAKMTDNTQGIVESAIFEITDLADKIIEIASNRDELKRIISSTFSYYQNHYNKELYSQRLKCLI